MPYPFLNQMRDLAYRTAQRIRVRSALNPMLWLCATMTPTLLYAAYQFQENRFVCIVLIISGLVPLSVTCCGFVGFAIFKPEKLQSEDYQLRHESLQIIQQKAGRMAMDSTSLEGIANPNQPLLEKGEE